MDKLFLQRTKAVEKQTSTNTSIQLDITYTDINMFPIINLLALFSFSIQIHFTKLQVNVNLLKKLLWVYIYLLKEISNYQNTCCLIFFSWIDTHLDNTKMYKLLVHKLVLEFHSELCPLNFRINGWWAWLIFIYQNTLLGKFEAGKEVCLGHCVPSRI